MVTLTELAIDMPNCIIIDTQVKQIIRIKDGKIKGYGGQYYFKFVDRVMADLDEVRD